MSRRLNRDVMNMRRELREYRDEVKTDRKASDELRGVLEEIGIEEEIA